VSPPTSSASAAIPFRPIDDSTLPGSGQWGCAILVCFVALAVIAWAMRRRGIVSAAWARGRGAQIEVLETRSLGPQTQLVVARYGSRRLLLSIGPNGTQCLRDDADDSEANT